MRNPHFKKMVKYGKWLETLLTKGGTWQLKKQFEEAIDVLNLDYQLPENDLSLRLIDMLEAENLVDYYTSHAYTLLDHDRMSALTSYKDGHDPLKIYSFMQNLQENEYGNRYDLYLFDGVLMSVLNMYQIKADTLNWFKGLLKGEVPWEYRPETPAGKENFTSLYNGIRSAIKFTAKDGYHRVNIFAVDHAELGIPVDVVLAHIALEFLLLGGEKYFNFCKHCTKFFTSKRGSENKKFCGDVCRVDHFKDKQKKKSQAPA